MVQENVERTFNVSSPARLAISNIRGSIQITPGNENEILVSAIKFKDSGDAARTEILMEQELDGTVRVTTRYRRDGFLVFGDRPCKVEYSVTVPKHCDVDCDGVSSRAQLQDLEGEFHISTVSGGVQARNLNGHLHLNTVSGQVSGEAISGLLDYETVSGNIRLVDSKLASIKGSSVSGSVWLQTGLEEGPYKFDTVSGSLYLLIPSGSVCTIDLHAVSSNLVTDLPITQETRQGGIRRAEIRGGGPLVRFNGISGNISVLAGEGANSSNAAIGQQNVVGTGQEYPIDTNEILDKIERGEITVDEGIARLKNKHKSAFQLCKTVLYHPLFC
jgi:hypothetical protein